MVKEQEPLKVKMLARYKVMLNYKLKRIGDLIHELKLFYLLTINCIIFGQCFNNCFLFFIIFCVLQNVLHIFQYNFVRFTIVRRIGIRIIP